MQDSRRTGRDREGSVWKGLAAGALGGLVAAWTMNRFQAAWSKRSAGVERSHGAQSLQQGSPRPSGRPGQRASEGGDGGDDATERLASALSEGLLGRELTESEKESGGTAVHYAFGVTTGALYGMAAELAPAVTAGAGLPFGMLVWVAADEGIVPALGLSKPPTDYPLSTHAYSISTHLVYGLTAELVRRAVRGAL